MFGGTIWTDWKLSDLLDFENDVQNYDFIQQTINDFGIIIIINNNVLL